MLRRMMMAVNSGPPPSLSFDTSMLTGRTFIYDPTASLILKERTTTGGSPSADGDPVQRIDSSAGPTTIRSFTVAGAGTTAFDWRVNEFGPGKHAIEGEMGPDLRFDLFNRPSAGNAPSTVAAMSALFAAGAKTLIFAGTINAAGPDQGNVYGNAALLADHSNYLGLHYYRSGTNAILQWYNYDSSVKVVQATVPLGTPFVVACRHASGVLAIRINNGTWVTTTSSGTGLLTAQATALSGFIGDNVNVGAFVTCNANNSDANIAACCTSAGALVGLAI